jgi:hypothetical protein
MALLDALERELLAAQADEVRNVWRESIRAQHHLGAKPGPLCRGPEHSMALSMLENFRSVDRWVPAFAGSMIHLATIGLQALPAGDSEVGANRFRHTLLLDAAQTEISKAIVYRFGIVRVLRAVFASRDECGEFCLRRRLPGSRLPLPKLRGDARRRRSARCKTSNETERGYRTLPHQALP